MIDFKDLPQDKIYFQDDDVVIYCLHNTPKYGIMNIWRCNYGIYKGGDSEALS